MTSVDSSLDSILHEIGDFGKYQMITFSLVCFGVVLHSAVHIAYVFTAMDLDYRCVVPECDVSKTQFEPAWLPNAIPYDNGKPDKCTRYIGNGNSSHALGNCSKSEFLPQTKHCDGFVYKTEEYSILREYDLQCDENLWKLTLVGTVNNIGQFFGLFISGLISDRFGRKVVFIIGMILCGVSGLLRTTASTYIWFLVFEFLDSGFGAGSYICGFIIGVELVGPKRRVMMGTLVSSCYAIGEIFAAGTAWIFQDWRSIIYVIYSPPLLLLAYFWLIPESVRWYLSKGRSEEAIEILQRVSQVNDKYIPEGALEKLKLSAQGIENKTTYKEFFKSPILVLRLVNSCFCWITCAFLFFGLTLNSMSLNENSYLNFILTSLVEVPAYFACVYLVAKWGRKWSLSSTFFLTGASCLAFLFIPEEASAVSLTAYLIGKFGATAAFTVAYVITSEIFPTPQRHSMMGICSTFGRLGSMVAPQTPLLAQVWTPLPLILFTVMSIAAGFLSLLFPETLGTKLPDTIEEAINIGNSGNKNDCEL